MNKELYEQMVKCLRTNNDMNKDELLKNIYNEIVKANNEKYNGAVIRVKDKDNNIIKLDIDTRIDKTFKLNKGDIK